MKKQFGRRPAGNKPAWKKSEARGGKPSFTKKSFSAEGKSEERRSSGDKPFGDKPKRKTFGDKPFPKNHSATSLSKNRLAETAKTSPLQKNHLAIVNVLPVINLLQKKPYSREASGGERKFGDKPFAKKPFGDRERSSDDKPFAKKPYSRESSGEKKFGDKPFKKSFGGDRERSSGDKPFAKKTFGSREPSRAEKRSGNVPYDKKPFTERGGYKGKSFGDKPYRKRDERMPDNNNEAKEKSFDNENWQVFDSTEEAKDFIKTTRKEKRSGKYPENVTVEYKNENRPLKAASYKDSEGSVRLNRFIANTGICSRREADDLIEAGVVKVNGKIVTELGTKIGPGDTVHYGDQLLRREKMAYVLLNKPKDYITTTDDPQERKTVMTLIETAGKERIYPVGRLDRNTTGLLLFTNDGDLAERLTHPKYGIRKIYHVSLDKNLKNDDFEKILNGFEMEDGFMKADELSYVGDGMDKKEVGIVIHSGRNRIVRRLFESLGYDVVRLDRVSYAGLTKKNLPRSSFRHLTPEEVGMLRMQVGGDKKIGSSHKKDRNYSKGKGKRKEK